MELWPAPVVEGRPLSRGSQIQASAKIQALYDAGVPIFTKDVIRKVVQAFDAALGEDRADQTVVVVGLDDVPVEFRVETGQTLPVMRPARPDQEYVWGKLCLSYQSVTYLTSGEGTAPSCAYLPFLVCRKLTRRHKSTGAIVHLGPRADQAEVAERLRSARARWEADDAWRQLRSLLDEHASAAARDAQKVVAFACSSMSFPGGESARSLFQHALALSIRDFLRSARGDPAGVQCFAQDPVYTEADESVLEQVGITVLDDPRGFLEVDDTSVVISIAPVVPVRELITDVARPVMMIWNTVPNVLHSNQALATDPVTSRVQKMIQSEYTLVELPHIDKFDSLRGVSLYIRKTAASSSM